MYEEGHRGFAFKSILLKLLLIIMIVFFIIWLFPTKNYVKNLIDQKLTTSTSQVFTTNIENMKNAATSYFSGNRLPSKEGVSKTLTLKDMIDQKLLVEFKDSNNKKCDVEKSYVTVTKENSDYKLKVNLACSDKKAYITTYMNNQSTSEVYSKKKLEDNSQIEEKKDNPKENDIKTQECQYAKKTNGYWNYGSWSAWSTTPIDTTNTREVQTKKEQTQVDTILEEDGTTRHTQNSKKVTLNNNGKQYTVYVCPADFDNGGSYNSFVTCVKTIPNYVNKPIYRYVTYYRYRDKVYINGNTTYKWSNCNDDNLNNQGYIKTGKTR